MKIVVISTPVFSVPLRGYGGLEAIAWECARGLATLGHDVKLVAPDGSTCPDVEVIQIGPPMRVSEEMAYGGFAEMKEGDAVVRPAHRGYWQLLADADVVIDHSWQKWAYCLKAEGILKAPVLAVMHAPVNTMYPPHPKVPKFCAVCISEDQAAHYRALHGVDARVCYNGIDLDFYKPIGLPRTDRFLFLARFSEIKGADLAIEACSKAGVGLDLVGDTQITNEPEYYHYCQHKINQHNATAMERGYLPQIRMVGPATRGECVRWFSTAHALLHPVMRFREPFGLAPVEAMACGCPVIAWDNGACRETIHPECGWLVKSLDQLVEAITAAKTIPGPGLDPVALRRYCRERASRFSVQNMVKRYEELCREAIETGGW